MRFENRTIACNAMFSVMAMLMLAGPAWAGHAKKGPLKGAWSQVVALVLAFPSSTNPPSFS